MQKCNVFEGLDERETRYVSARAEAVSNREALRLTCLSQSWLNKHDIDDLNERASTLRADTALKASRIISDAGEQAARVKVDGLKCRDDRVKQAVASEILERILGKTSQHVEFTGADNNALEIVVRYADQTNRTDLT